MKAKSYFHYLQLRPNPGLFNFLQNKLLVARYNPTVVAEWSKTVISQIQVENAVAQVPGSNPAWDTNMVAIMWSLMHPLYVAPAILDIPDSW